MKKIKKILSVILLITMVSGTLSSCQCSNFSFDKKKENTVTDNKDSDSEKITRGEWAKLLGDKFGLDSCNSISPYFKDVDTSSPYFVYIQSGVEWEIYSVDADGFKPDDYATKEFILETSMKAAEIKQADGSEKIGQIASDNGLLSESDSDSEKMSDEKIEKIMKEEPSVDYAEKVLTWANTEYISNKPDEYENITLKDSVKDMPEVKPDENGKFTSNNTDLKVGDIIITAPTEEFPAGVAKKVVAINYDASGNAVIDTEEPEIGEVFEDLDFTYTADFTKVDKILAEDGVTATITQSEYEEELGYYENNSSKAEPLVQYINGNDSVNTVGKKDKGISFEFKVDLAKGSLKTSSISYNGFTAEIINKFSDEEKNSWEKSYYSQVDDFKIYGDVQTVKTTGKYKKDVYSVEGYIKLKNIKLDIDYKTKKVAGIPWGISKLDYTVNYELESTLEVSGNISSELKIGTVPIPLGTSGVAVNLDVFISTDLNGEIKVTDKISSVTKVSYSEKCGKKKTTNTDNKETGFEAGGEAEITVGSKATISAVGIKLIDCKVEIGAGVEVEGKVTRAMRDSEGVYKYNEAIIEEGKCEVDYLLCTGLKVYYPVLKVEIGKTKETLANKLGIKFKWKIIDKSGATFKSKIDELHFEADKGFGFDCSYDELPLYEGVEETESTIEIESATEETTTNDNSILGGGMINISVYALSMDSGDNASVSVVSIPDGYSADDLVWSIEDESVAKISNKNKENCSITAASPGVTYLVVSTLDGEYSMKCTIMVSNSEDVTFTPLD